MPLLREIVGAGLPDTDEERVADWHGVMEEGEATKGEMTGATDAAATLTVTLRLTVPALFVAVKVKVLVTGGVTDRVVPVTAKVLMVLLKDRVGAGLPDTDQERVEAWPAAMEEGMATKEEMTGATVEPAAEMSCGRLNKAAKTHKETRLRRRVFTKNS